MRPPRITLQISLCAIALAGCASSGVVLVGPETYLVRKQDGLGLTGMAAPLQADLREESESFCLRTGRAAEPIKELASPGIPLVRSATAELRFRCVAI